MKPSSSLAASDIMSIENGGSKVNSNSTSLTPSMAFIFSFTSSGKTSAAGHEGEVNVIKT